MTDTPSTSKMANQELERQAFLTKELLKQIVSSEVNSLKQEIETPKTSNECQQSRRLGAVHKPRGQILSTF